MLSLNHVDRQSAVWLKLVADLKAKRQSILEGLAAESDVTRAAEMRGAARVLKQIIEAEAYEEPGFIPRVVGTGGA